VGQYERYLAREAPLEEIYKYLGYFDSYAHTERMVTLLCMASARRRLAIFLEIANDCDAPWGSRSILFDMLRRARAEVNC
jgi:hypothetical protein